MTVDNAQEYVRDNFEILKELRTTEKNTVLIALNKNDNLVYIIKHSKLKGVPYKELQSINQPILPKIFFVVESPEHTTIVEEYIHGHNLQELLEESGNFTEDLCSNILQQLCLGLIEVHKNRIIHRDIKPSNIILTDSNTVKLIDFDAIRITKDDKDYDTQYLGTRGYAPPEQYGFGQTDVRADIYALGITFKELLGSDYSGRLLPLLDKCTELNPKDRYQTAEELLSALNRPTRNYKKPVLVLLSITLVIFAGFKLYNNYQTQPVAPVSISESDKAAPTPATDKSISVPDDKNKATASQEKEATPKTTTPPKLPDKAVSPPTNPTTTVDPSNNLTMNPVLKEDKVPPDKLELSVQYSGSGDFYKNHRIMSKIIYPSCKNWRPANLKSLDFDKPLHPSYYFPNGEYLVATFTNNSEQVLLNPIWTLGGDVIYDDSYLSGTEGKLSFSKSRFFVGLNEYLYWQKSTVLNPGESLVFQIPLSNVILEYVAKDWIRRSMTVGISGDNFDREHHEVSILFKDFEVKESPFK